MWACTELLTMCLQAAKHSQKPNSGPERDVTSKPAVDSGLSIFHDIFRRADKNDDGKLSFQEFKNYFADGILSSNQLLEMFTRADKSHRDNLDTEQLCEYFSHFLGEYQRVLSALDELNIAILMAMDKTKLDYENSSTTEQFVTRFLIREVMNQLQSLQGSLECAMETIEGQTCQGRNEVQKSSMLSQRMGRRCGRRGLKSICLSPVEPYSSILNSGTSKRRKNVVPSQNDTADLKELVKEPTGVYAEPENPWISQINRLQHLIDKLECKSLRLEPLNKELTDETTNHYIVVAQRQFSVLEDDIDEFRQLLKQYSSSTLSHSACLHVSVQDLSNEACFIVYEFWQERTSWRSHLQSAHSKTFQRTIQNFLASPELLTTMLLPASWWIMNK
ncbi:N-terminal EF-hand calcium-binding protein 3 [Protopterus annectens]|uniref:N-terminal EF-hand calcium-binding protein 3 n=1 Tax=Protopterus annectens TaxID=7888 RepID=UPI001CFBA34A|nr:N-terminal EF-hand calcium-binding protein 3 [Protopterus annectens]